MMDPKKCEELLIQEDHYREKYVLTVTLDLATAPDQNFSGEEIHSATMTVSSEDNFLLRDCPVFQSDENGAFYRQADAMTNARIKLVDWFKVSNIVFDSVWNMLRIFTDIFLAHRSSMRSIPQEEEQFRSDLEDGTLNGTSREAWDYIGL